MSCEPSNNRSCIFDSLCDNVNNLVTVYTDGGCCFTGLLVSVCCDCIKLVTQTCNKYPGGRYGKVTVIPICEIVAVTFCNTSV